MKEWAIAARSFFHYEHKEGPAYGQRWTGGTPPRWRGRGGDYVKHPQFAQAFYNSTAWKHARALKKKQAGGLCERCLARGLIVPGVHVHHKIRLTPENLNDPSVTLNLDNLELLCEPCHQQEHQRETQMRTDAAGRVIW